MGPDSNEERITEAFTLDSKKELRAWQEAAVSGEHSVWALLREVGDNVSLESLCDILETKECRKKSGRAIEILAKRGSRAAPMIEQFKSPCVSKYSEEGVAKTQLLAQQAYCEFLGFDQDM